MCAFHLAARPVHVVLSSSRIRPEAARAGEVMARLENAVEFSVWNHIQPLEAGASEVVVMKHLAPHTSRWALSPGARYSGVIHHKKKPKRQV